jgi:hypothetical protein
VNNVVISLFFCHLKATTKVVKAIQTTKKSRVAFYFKQVHDNTQMEVHQAGNMDNFFLPTIFVIFVSSLASVFVVNYYSKPSNITPKWAVITTCLYLLSAISFILQLKASWMLDFLHQVHLVAEPVLWQRLLGDFILVSKLVGRLTLRLFVKVGPVYDI